MVPSALKNMNPNRLGQYNLKMANIVLLMAFFLFLEYIYKSFVSYHLPHLDYTYDFHLVKYIETKILFVLALILSYHIPGNKGFLYFMSLIVTALMLIPNLIIYEFAADQRLIPYLTLFFLLTLWLVSRWQKEFIFRIYPIPERYKILILLLLVCFLLIPFAVDFGFKLNWRVLSLQEIYEVRDQFKETLNIWTAYTYSPVGKVLIPVLLIYSLSKKRYAVVAFALIAFFYIYMIGAHKMLFFGLFLMLALYPLKNYHLQVTGFLGLFLALLLIGYCIYICFDSTYLESTLSRRFLFTPALLNYYYFDFFENNHLFLSHSVLSHFFEYPYDLEPAYKIGEVYRNDPDQSCNNGFLSTGYMNFGIAGALVNIIFLALVFKLIDDMRVHPNFTGIFFIMFYILFSRSLTTSLLTQGFFLLIVISYFFLMDTRHGW